MMKESKDIFEKSNYGDLKLMWLSQSKERSLAWRRKLKSDQRKRASDLKTGS